MLTNNLFEGGSQKLTASCWTDLCSRVYDTNVDHSASDGFSDLLCAEKLATSLPAAHDHVLIQAAQRGAAVYRRFSCQCVCERGGEVARC